MVPELPVALLACARLGVIHSVVFGGFSAEALKTAHPGSGRPTRHHLRWRLAPRQGSQAQGRRRRSPRRMPSRAQRHRLSAHRRRDPHAGRPRSLVARARSKASPKSVPPSRSIASIRSYVLYTSGTTGKPKGIVHTTGRLPAARHHDHEVGLRPARRRHLLVHRRYRLGDRPQLHRLRTALGRRHQHDVRGRARFPAARPLLAAHREVPRQHFLHLADGHPRLHPAGRSVAQCARYVEPAAARVGRRAHQSRGLGVVSQDDRQASAARSSIPGGRPKPAPS